MLRQISSHIHGWSEIHGAARNEPYPWNSYLIDVPNNDVVVLVDPLPISSSDAQEIEQIRTPTHIFLTCELHLRESESLRQRWGCEIWANEVELDRHETSLVGRLSTVDDCGILSTQFTFRMSIFPRRFCWHTKLEAD